MDRWKSRGGKSQRREETKKEDQRKKSVRRKKMQVREKVGKSWNTVFFQWFVAPEGRKVGSLKRRVRSQLARWEMKNCTPLWRKAHFQVKMYKARQLRSTFTKLRCRKSARRCGAKHILKEKWSKDRSVGALWEDEMLKKIEVKMYKAPHARATFGRWSGVLCGRHKGFCTLSKVRKMWRFCSISKNDGRHGSFEEDLQRCIFRGRCSTRDMFIRDVRSSGRWFPESGCIFGASDLQIFWDDFAWQVQHFVWPGITFSWQAQYFRQMECKNHKTHWYEAVSSALNFPFLKDVSQNCFVFDVVNFENWGCLAGLFRFWRCLQIGKSRRIAAFLMLSSSKTEEVSQNSFVFKLADRQIDR